MASFLHRTVLRQPKHLRFASQCRMLSISSDEAPPRVVSIGLGNMGGPLHGQIARKFPTSVYDTTEGVAEEHSAEWGSTAVTGIEDLRSAAATANIITTCLPNTSATRAVWELLQPQLQGDHNKIWIDATSGRADEAALLAHELLEHGVQYLDCAVSGGPVGAKNAVLAALVGGDSEVFQKVEPVIGCFSDKITYLGPAGSGHLVKSINNAMLGAHMLVASEGLAALSRHNVDVGQALKAINGSSGRSWVTMQRFPDNILTGNEYGFALGMHCKDMENAMHAVKGNIQGSDSDLGPIPSPILDLARNLMNMARQELGPNVDHTETSRLASRAHGISFQNR